MINDMNDKTIRTIKNKINYFDRSYHCIVLSLIFLMFKFSSAEAFHHFCKLFVGDELL